MSPPAALRIRRRRCFRASTGPSGGRGAAGVDVLPHVSGNGHHGVSVKRGTLEHAQRIAGHASPKTTKLHPRPADTVSLDEIERIVI